MSLISDLPEAEETAEIRLNFAVGCNFKELGKQVIDDLTEYVAEQPYLSPAPQNFEGIRINFDREHGEGWALVRMSLHEPIMPINVESNIKSGVSVIVRELASFFARYSFLDTAKFEQYL